MRRLRHHHSRHRFDKASTNGRNAEYIVRFRTLQTLVRIALRRKRVCQTRWHTRPQLRFLDWLHNVRCIVRSGRDQHSGLARRQKSHPPSSPSRHLADYKFRVAAQDVPAGWPRHGRKSHCDCMRRSTHSSAGLLRNALGGLVIEYAHGLRDKPFKRRLSHSTRSNTSSVRKECAVIFDVIVSKLRTQLCRLCARCDLWFAPAVGLKSGRFSACCRFEPSG